MGWKERAGLPQARSGCVAGVIGRQMVVAGGSYWQGDKKFWSDRTDVFDPGTNTWTSADPMPQARSDAASATFQGHVYALGGVVNGTLSADILEFDGRRWKALDSDKLPAPVMYPVAAATDSGILLLGGLTAAGDLSSASRTLWFWAPGSSLQRRADFPGVCRVSAAVAEPTPTLNVTN